jgi:RNA polymerase sigma-70 factor (ECF subfamily)
MPLRSKQPPATGAPPGAADFDALYEARYGDVVAMAHALTGDLAEAQDLAQEAFCRAWQRWATVSRYDEPLTWIRRVTANLATSRWRRLRVARLALRRDRPATVPPLEPDRVLLVAALRRLPVDQRRALVLHHLIDLPVAEVALELGVAVGTVKSWLHRGRLSLAAHLAEPGGTPAAEAAAARAVREPATRAARRPTTAAPPPAPAARAPATPAARRAASRPAQGGDRR